jgi:hypothetical protein
MKYRLCDGKKIGFPDGDIELLHLGSKVDGCHQDLLGVVVHHRVPQVKSLNRMKELQ